jgi:hypothetical protein
MYSYATLEKFNTFIIDKETSDTSKKFRKNFLNLLNYQKIADNFRIAKHMRKQPRILLQY